MGANCWIQSTWENNLEHFVQILLVSRAIFIVLDCFPTRNRSRDYANFDVHFFLFILRGFLISVHDLKYFKNQIWWVFERKILNCWNKLMRKSLKVNFTKFEFQILTFTFPSTSLNILSNSRKKSKSLNSSNLQSSQTFLFLLHISPWTFPSTSRGTTFPAERARAPMNIDFPDISARFFFIFASLSNRTACQCCQIQPGIDSGRPDIYISGLFCWYVFSSVVWDLLSGD